MVRSTVRLPEAEQQYKFVLDICSERRSGDVAALWHVPGAEYESLNPCRGHSL